MAVTLAVGGLRLRLALWPVLATVAGLALFVHLGLWQWGKAQAGDAARARRAAFAQLAPAGLRPELLDAQASAGKSFVVRGFYDAGAQFFIDNRENDGVAGVHVITPLRIEGGLTRVLVDRGWIAWPQGRRVLPDVPVPEGPVQLLGTADLPSTRKPLFVSDAIVESDRLWTRPDLAHFRQVSGQPLQPFVLLEAAVGAPADGLVRRWQAPEDRTTMYRGYAYQWFAIAGALLVFFFHAAIKNGRRAA